jgi:hypothetical protein
LRAEWRVPEDQQHRRSELDIRIPCQLGLVDFIEKFDAFVGNVPLQTLDRLSDWIRALHRDDAVVAGKDR